MKQLPLFEIGNPQGYWDEVRWYHADVRDTRVYEGVIRD